MRWSTLREELEAWLRDAWDRPGLRVESAGPPSTSAAELAEPWRQRKYPTTDGGAIEGVVPLDLVLREEPGADARRVPVMLKVRRSAGLGRTLLPDLYRRAGIDLPQDVERYPAMGELLTCGEREIAVYRLEGRHEAFARYLPALLADRVDADEDEYLLMIERVDGAELMDSADDVSGWDPRSLESLVVAAAELHAVHLDRVDELGGWPWPRPFGSTSVLASVDLWSALADAARRAAPDLVTEQLHEKCRRLVESVADWYPAHDLLPHTLVHDDYNQRNACLRPRGTPLVYDWELALVDLPQRDLAELLTFSLHSGEDDAIVGQLVEAHRRRLSEAAGVELDPDAWWEGFRIELRFEAINRLALQCVFRIDFALGYTPRIVANLQALLDRYG